MSAVTPYVTKGEADVILDGVEPWESSTDDAAKETAVIQAKIYFDQIYKCPDFDSEDPSDIVKEANAILANYNLTQNIFTRQTGNGPLEESEVKAEGVSVRKRYNSKGMSPWKDPFPDVTALLYQEGCSIQFGGAISTNALVRA